MKRKDYRKKALDGGWTAPGDYQTPRTPPKPGSVNELVNEISRSLATSIDGVPVDDEEEV